MRCVCCGLRCDALLLLLCDDVVVPFDMPVCVGMFMLVGVDCRCGVCVLVSVVCERSLCLVRYGNVVCVFLH